MGRYRYFRRANEADDVVAEGGQPDEAHEKEAQAEEHDEGDAHRKRQHVSVTFLFDSPPESGPEHIEYESLH